MSTDPKTYFTDTADPGQTDFSFNFEYLEDAHVTVTIDGAATTDFTIVTSPAKKIVLDTPATGGEIVRVQRISAPDENLVDFVNGSVLTESELDRAYLHNRYLAEESAEQNDISLRVKTGATGSFDALNKKIVNVSDPTADQDAATKNYVDDTVAGVVGGTIPDGSITAAKLDTDAVTTVKIEDSAVTSAKIEDGAVTSAKIEDGAVTSAKTDFNEVIVNNTSGNGRVEVGGTTGAYIDLKTPDTDDYDGRLWIEGDTESLKVIGKHGLEFKVGTNPSTVCTIDSNGDLTLSGDIDITGNYKVNGTNLQTVPTGTVSAFAGSSAPTGYLLCDGTAVNRTTYATLFGVISDTYGAGDGSTTFNLPDLRGRVVAGMGGSLLSGTDAVAHTGGVKEVTLTAAQSGLPEHTHAGTVQSTLQTDSGSGRLTNDAGNLTGGVTGGAQDASSAHTNVQPTIILNYIIKT